MPKICVLLFSIVGWLACLTLATAMPASDLEISVVPAKLEISGVNPGSALLLLQNISEKSRYQLKISWFTDTGYQPRFADSLNFELAPGNSKALPFQIIYQQEGSLDGTIFFKINGLRHTPDSKNVPVSHSVVSFAVTSGLTDAAKIAQIELQTTTDALDEHRPGLIYLMIRNKADIPISIESIETFRPPFLECARQAEILPVRLAPRETGVFETTLKITDVVQPGKYLVLFKINLAWQIAGKTFRETLTTNHPVNVGVFGESVILTALAVPSFLILPGFLILTTIILLWRLGIFRDKGSVQEFPVKASTPEFWLIGIFLSFLMAWFYPLLTGRNYLEGYNLQDIVRIWMLSLGLGLLLFLLIAESIKIHRHWYTPAEHDLPLRILKKLHRQGLGFKLEQAEAMVQNQKVATFLIEPRYENQLMFWIAPPIVVEIPENADLTDQKQLDEKLRNENEPAELARFLQSGRKRGSFKIYWMKNEYLGGPRLVKMENINFLKPAQMIEKKLAD